MQWGFSKEVVLSGADNVGANRGCHCRLSVIYRSCHMAQKQTRIVCMPPKGLTQCIFPRSQHSCLYVYIYILIPSCSQPAVGSNIVQITRISGHFRSIRNFIFLEILDKMAALGHFVRPKFTLDRISGNFRSIGHFGFQKLTNKIFLWTNDIVKTEHKQLKHGIHSR